MKNKLIKINSLIAASSLLLLAACSKFIETQPETKVPVAATDYSNISQMYMPVSGVYANAAAQFASWNAQGLIVVRGDDVDKGSSSTDQVEYTYCKTFRYDKLSSYWALNATWQNLYRVVQVSNDALISLNEYAKYLTTDDQKKQNKSYAAEVRFLRAYALFRISNFWGNVPLLLNNQEIGPKKIGVDSIRSFIKNEMDTCIANLPVLRPNERTDAIGAVTKYTALALKAKVQLYMKDYQGALASTNDIINSGRFKLYDDYYQLFKIPGKLADESLYELQFTDFGSGSGNIVESDNWFAFQGPPGENTPSFIRGWGFMTPSQELRTFFAGRQDNVRAKTTLLLAGASTPDGDVISAQDLGRPNCFNGKAYTPSNQMTTGRTSYGANNNIRVIRYSDVLLMNAEVKIRLGQNGDAPLNLVRQRAGLTNITGATLDNVLDERRAELAIEWGERFFDLVRTDKAQTVLPGFVKGQSEYYPIPQDQIDQNPNLK